MQPSTHCPPISPDDIRRLIARYTAQAWPSLPPEQGVLWRVCADLSALLGEDYGPTHYPEEGMHHAR